MPALTTGTAAALLTPLMLVGVWMGLRGLRRAWTRTRPLVEEFALAGAWVFVVGGGVWAIAYLSDLTLLGFASPWTGLTAAHFFTAGFGAWSVTAMCCRVVSGAGALRLLRVLVCLHPLAYGVVAAGISGVEGCDELGALAYLTIFVLQLGAVLRGTPDRIGARPRRLLLLALVVPLVTMLPALAWAFGRPMLDLGGMALYHGLGNAIGHVGLGWWALAWGRPPAHAALQEQPDAAQGQA